MAALKKIRQFIFLRDVLVLALTCIGGPQAHLAVFFQKLVQKRAYLSEEELLELQSLCSMLPGPTSTQTLTAVGYRLGGRQLAFLTLIVWISPACICMALLAMAYSFVDHNLMLRLTQFIKPMGIAFIFFAASSISFKYIRSKTSFFLTLAALAIGYMFRSPYMTPAVIFGGGIIASLKFRAQNKIQKSPLKVEYQDLVAWALFFLVLVGIGTLTKSLPIRLFENFYRNGSFAFGGGHVLKPLLYNEFVEFKKYLSTDQFLAGISFAEIIPGPTFSIASYVGALSMSQQGVSGQILGALVGSLGIFLPGIFMIFFAIKVWDKLKQYRGIRASLEGINAATIGLTFAAGFSLFMPICNDNKSIFTVFLTLVCLYTHKIPPYVLIALAMVIGFYY